MFDNTSRYAELETKKMRTPEGPDVAYIRRRFLPRGEIPIARTEVTVTQGDRLDLIAAAGLGDPELFWRICDANDAICPLDLTAEPGRIIRIPSP